MSAPLLEVEGVGKTYAMGGIFSRQHFDAVADVSFTLDAARPEIFTVVGESGVYRLPTSGGAPSLVLDATGMGIVRDVAVGPGVLYLVAGGEIDVIDTSNGRMQEDAGGRVFRYDLTSGTLTPLTPEDGPWYRRLALHPEGDRLLAEREGNLWMLETPGT